MVACAAATKADSGGHRVFQDVVAVERVVWRRARTDRGGDYDQTNPGRKREQEFNQALDGRLPIEQLA